MMADPRPAKKNSNGEHVLATTPPGSDAKSDMLSEPVPGTEETEGLARFARRLHAAIEGADEQLSVGAWRVGQALTFIKGSRRHGGWRDWPDGREGYCEGVLGIHRRKAQRYVKLRQVFKTEDDIRPFGLTEAYEMCHAKTKDGDTDNPAGGAAPDGGDSDGTGTDGTGSGATDDSDDPTAEVEKLRKALEKMADGLAGVPGQLQSIDDAHVAVGTVSSYVEMLQNLLSIASAVQPATAAVLAACEKFKDLADQSHDAQRSTVLGKVRETAAKLAEMVTDQLPLPKPMKVHTPVKSVSAEPTECKERESDAA